MKSKLRQIYYDMRHQPVIAWVTFLATAMSVFLIMTVVMVQQIRVVPFAPESCRDRLLVAPYIHTEDLDRPGYGSSGRMTYQVAHQLYDGLDGVERIGYFTCLADATEVRASGSGEEVTARHRTVDAGFFDVFDFTLVEGRFFTPEETDAMVPVALISESTARSTLGSAPWTGREIIIDNNRYTVAGVFRNVSTLAEHAHADVFTPTGPSANHLDYNDQVGSLAVAMVVADGVDFGHIRDQVRARYSELDAQLAADSMKTVYHGSPFAQEIFATCTFGSNTTPDPSPGRRTRMTLYAILLLVPAINLSSMLHSRLRRRINEIGIRRAFGCTRRRIITDIIAENFLVTLAGGIVGVILGVIFAATYSGLYETHYNIGRGDTPALGALLHWSTIISALVICFILNILSASVPAWQASRMQPVDALNRK